MGNDSAPNSNSARLTLDGPLLLKGRIRYTPAAGAAAVEHAEVALCRCGGSASKPFCDGSHRRNGFADAGGCAHPPASATQLTEGDLVLNPVANGPLRVDGWFELATTDGQRFLCGDRTWLCRCGASANKPFCDGSHRKIGFAA
jgi:CDGSH-type Zn-finger protein